MITLIIIGGLLFSGSVSAVDVSLTGLSDSTPFEGNGVTFRINVDIVGAERVPVQSITLFIGNNNCTFYPNATKVSGDLCDAISIEKNNNVPYGFGYGTLYGYGTNVTGQYAHTSFGTGYGYNNSLTNEFDYVIFWTAPDVDEQTPYDVRVDVNAVQGSNSFTYSKTESAYFTVQPWFRTGGGRFIPSVAPENPKASHYWSSILQEGSSVMRISNEEIAFTRLSFNVDTELHKVDVVVERLLEEPTDVPIPSGTVYQFIRVSKENLKESDIETVTIRFKVAKEWLEQKDIPADEITLYKYTNQWIKLQTRKLNTESDWVHYEAFAPSFSLFAIGSATPISIPVTRVETPRQVQQEPTRSDVIVETIEGEGSQPMVEKKVLNTILLVAILLVIIVGGSIGFVSYRKLSKTRETTKVEQYLQEFQQPSFDLPDLDKTKAQATRYPEMDNYIKECLKLKMSMSKIRQNLLNVGWPKNAIDEAMRRFL